MGRGLVQKWEGGGGENANEMERTSFVERKIEKILCMDV